MEETEIKKQEEAPEEKIYSKKEFEELKASLEFELKEKEAKLREEIELENKKVGMSELELTKTELEEYKKKYEESVRECSIAKQKEETIGILNDSNLDPSILDVVFVPLDLEQTRQKIVILKNYIEKIKKEIFQNLEVPIPLTSANQKGYDAFLEGFDTNRL